MKHLAVLIAVVCASMAGADEVWLQPDGALSNDTHTRQLDPNNPQNHNYISVSAVGYDNGLQCAFIEFTELDNYMGATVSQAKIHMYAFRSMASGHLLIGPCNAAWDEATLTWNTMPGVYESHQIDYCSFYQWTVIDVTSYVQSMLNGTRDNHGFCLFDNDGDDEGMDLQSGEYDDADYRPKLYLEYTPSALTPSSWGRIKADEAR